ncbi:hypothetical protein [Nocardia aobensis]|uniref:hypothetical protein n=1 Tax=Nocardia aobensis TaxID=257277 RepID=UPI0002DC6799
MARHRTGDRQRRRTDGARRTTHPRGTPQGGRLGLPADFLIASDGSLAASHYGTHADDQWTVDDVLSRARKAG